MNIQLLKTELDKSDYTGKTATECAALLNAPTIEYFAEVPNADLTNFLMGRGMYAKLLAVYRDHQDKMVRIAAEGAIALAQSQITSVNIQNPTIQQALPALVAGGVWTQAEADSMLNFARRTKSRAKDILGQNVTEADVNAARWLDQTELFSSKIAILTLMRDSMASGDNYHELSEAL